MRRPCRSGNFLQASISSAMFHFLLTGITSPRCSSLVALSEMASFTSVSAPKRSIIGTRPTVETVMCRWEKFSPSSDSRSVERRLQVLEVVQRLAHAHEDQVGERPLAPSRRAARQLAFTA